MNPVTIFILAYASGILIGILIGRRIKWKDLWLTSVTLCVLRASKAALGNTKSTEKLALRYGSGIQTSTEKRQSAASYIRMTAENTLTRSEDTQCVQSYAHKMRPTGLFLWYNRKVQSFTTAKSRLNCEAAFLWYNEDTELPCVVFRLWGVRLQQ